MWKFALTLVALAIIIKTTQADCPRNQIYDLCPSSCPPRTCATRNIQYRCITPPQVGDPNCPAPKCRCENGFYSNINGDCVIYEQCAECPQNEVYDLCPNPCPPRTCNTSDILFNCLAGPTYPDPACPTPVCRCADGFHRNDQGNCVTEEECPKNCPKNEVFDLCPASCPPRTCASKDALFKCVAPLEVGDPNCPASACRCADSFYRNDNGACVTYEECGTECPQNEVYDLCPNPCPPRTCNTSDILFNCLAGPTYPDPACPTPVCRCADGFYRNDQGNCVTQEECPKNCPKNEVLDLCPASCPPRTCVTKDALFKCVAPLEVGDPNCPASACRCADGFYRNDNGACVTYKECGNYCLGTNEVWDSCTPSSPPQTCDYLNGYQKARKSGKCTAQCRCKDGYYRNFLGDCIAKERCLECSGPNEFWSCGGACDNVCETLSQQNQTSCPIINIKCNEMCYCKEGYARNAKGICVAFAKCKNQKISSQSARSEAYPLN